VSCFVLVVSGVRSLHAGESTETLPIQLYDNYVVVQASLGGRGNCTVVIDTGVNPSIVHSRTAQELKLTAVPKKLRMLDREVETAQAELPGLDLGPIHRQSLPVLVHDLSQMERNLGIRIDALVGLDVLGETNFTVDYIRRYIAFGPVQKTPSSAKMLTVQPGPIVEAKIEGRPVRLLLDTGSPGLILFFDPAGGPAKTDLVEASAQGPRQRLVKQARVGNYDLVPGKAIVIAGQGGQAVDGLLGVAPLHPRSVAFDFERKRVYWKSYDAPNPVPRPNISATEECSEIPTRAGLSSAGKSPATASAQFGYCRDSFGGIQHLNRN
jgi:hypothetical protein